MSKTKANSAAIINGNGQIEFSQLPNQPDPFTVGLIQLNLLKNAGHGFVQTTNGLQSFEFVIAGPIAKLVIGEKNITMKAQQSGGYEAVHGDGKLYANTARGEICTIRYKPYTELSSADDMLAAYLASSAAKSARAEKRTVATGRAIGSRRG